MRAAFEPARHRRALTAIIREVCAASSDGVPGPLSNRQMHAILRRHPRDGSGFFSRSQIIAGFRALARLESFDLDERSFVSRVQLRPVRTLSGVAPVTVFTKPFPCPGRCIFCPNDVRMPKSYLSSEPGCQRAEQNDFDPYRQTFNRLRALRAIGHATDKVEVIVLGGTWSFYPHEYQRWFVSRCYQAMNDFGAAPEAAPEVAEGAVDYSPLPFRLDGAELGESYNRRVGTFLKERHGGELLGVQESASWEQLEAVQLDNESAACRTVGFVVETRPDHLSEEEVLLLRRLGCTKVQLGLQSTSDSVLRANRRDHDLRDNRLAVERLRAAGFKIHAHWMLNLLGSTPDEDCQDFDRLFSDLALRPDELKVYPCSLVHSAELMTEYQAGRYRPYEHGELLQVLTHVVRTTPRYCRLSRVVRDIPSGEIVVGNRLSNFRELAERALDEQGLVRRDIRSREIRSHAMPEGELCLRRTQYAVSAGRELFLELTTAEDRVAGFLRLSLPQRASFVPELGSSAVIRELHVYGAALAIGERGGQGAQHRGLGRRLLSEAAAEARAAGHRCLSVISAVGTRGYYRAAGFEDGALYQHLALEAAAP